MPKIRSITLVAFLVLACVAPAMAKRAMERWYVLRMGDNRVGYMHITEKENADGDYVTDRTMLMKIKRGNDVLEVKIESTTTENMKQKTFAGKTLTLSGNTRVTQRFEYKGMDGIDYHISQNGQDRKGTIAATEVPLLGPEMSRRYYVAQLARGEKEIKFHTFDLATAFQPFRVDVRVKENKEVELFGRVVPAVATESVNSNTPTITSHDFVDAHGVLVKSTTELAPGMKMEMLLADRDLALAEVDPPEILAATMITADKPIHGPRRTRKATFMLTLAPIDVANKDAAKKHAQANDAQNNKPPPGDNEFTIKLPTAGYQTVTVKGAALQVDVDLARPGSAKDDKVTKWHSLPSTICDSEDEKIVALVKKALKNVGENAKPQVKAERLRAFVQRYVRSKDLSVGFGHASEVARTRQGDCTEHAVLLAAMLRAADIPSRGVTGLIYADQFVGQKDSFAYHMWTQAWIANDNNKNDGYWLDLDPTLPGQAFDATHIALSTTVLNEMADGASNEMIAVLPLLGRLKIEIVEIK